MNTQSIIQWEYLFVVCDAYYVRETQNHIRFEVLSVNGDASVRREVEKEMNTAIIGTKIERVKFRQGPTLAEFLRVKGQEGWEVCGSSIANDYNIERVFCVIMKRAILK